jgi:hypothetical protein
MTQTTTSPPVPPAPVDIPTDVPSAPQSTSRSAASRIEALDLVRLVAIVGMMTTHLLVPLAQGAGGAAWQQALARAGEVLTEGPSATLFAVIGGCSLVLSTRGRLRAGDRRGAVLSGVTRGALVLAIGLLLGYVPTSVIVVLVPFGLGMMLTAPLLLCSDRVLIAIAAVLALVGGPANAALRMHLQVVQDIGNVTPLNLAHPVILVRGLALTGMYPLVTWLPYMLLGVLLMRSMLRAIDAGTARRWSARTLALGAGAALVAYIVSALAKAWARHAGVDPLLISLTGFGGPVKADPWVLLAANPHTGTLTDMVATAGLAVALIGMVTLLLPPQQHLTSVPGRTLRAAGAAPLTVYTGHVLLTGIALILALITSGGLPTAMPWYVGGPWILLAHLLLLAGFGLMLARRGTRGPLEAFVSRTVRRVTEH